jgi:hypothetical protein
MIHLHYSARKFKVKRKKIKANLPNEVENFGFNVNHSHASTLISKIAALMLRWFELIGF